MSGPLHGVVPLLEHLQAFAGAQPSDSSGVPYAPHSPLLGRGPSPSSPAAATQPDPLPARTPPRFPSASSSRTLGRPEVASSSTVPVAQDPLPGDRPRASSSSTRQELASNLAACPAVWLDRAPSLSATANLNGRERILRAWKAGAWARLVLQGVVGAPAASPQLNIPSRYYVVLGGPGVQPALYRSFKEYSAALGPLEQSAAVSHAFPSELEAQVYCAGALVPWPLQRQE